ncbi:hypothetical protein [Parasediminibacterium sp. JCM 36343]|uniref:hypothetical protein n=1 Tax=Parasediminibacterium sp. JCM 36343 TaxID=3374279 RepID=UPI00397A5B9F
MRKIILACCCIWGSFVVAQKQVYILDMVHNNPGEPLTVTAFNNPAYLKEKGYNGQVMNDFTFAHAAITFDKLNPQIFPQGSKERAWVMAAADRVRKNIKAAHDAGIKVYYFTDLIVLPKKLVELYHDQICDAKGKISLERPKTIEIHKIMLDELFETFPDLDGLVIRTGETYLNNVPYHTGNNPITNGVASHVKLINLLREEVCEKRNKAIFYRTWSFGGMHDSAAYYLAVTNQIEPHKNLVFSIKHTKGDYHRTYDFNPTLGIGKHAQIVEVECQREYEGKGAYPNYVMDGVINGFEEYNTIKPQTGNKCLNDIKNNPNFTGVWSWSRGGGWVGPYISNEFWCKLNAYVISKWGADKNRTEESIFNSFMDENGIVQSDSRKAFRQLCLLSAKAVLRGHESGKYHFEKDWVWWMRDEFLGGIDTANLPQKMFPSEGFLQQAFDWYYKNGLLDKVIEEKQENVGTWKQIVALSAKIEMPNKADKDYMKVSSKYGLLLHAIIADGWKVMALGYKGDKTGIYDKAKLAATIKKYDEDWKVYNKLKAENPACASLYKPFSFINVAPTYHGEQGMAQSVDKYRAMLGIGSEREIK